MPRSARLRAAVLGAAALVLTAGGFAAQLTLADGAAAVTTTKVELKGGQLKVEGQSSPAKRVVVESTVSASSVRSDQNGLFRLQASGFSAPDCRLTVRDGTTPTATVSIPGRTPTVRPPSTPAAPTGSCVITPQPAATTLTAGSQSVFWMAATGCDPSSPLLFTLVSGGIPTGMTMATFQTSSLGNVIGIPSVRGTYRFTVQATDASGATDQETFTITVV